jgi:hypothetical protein
MSKRQEILDRRKEDIIGPKKAPNKNVNAQMFTFLARSRLVSLLSIKEKKDFTVEKEEVMNNRETNDLR